MSQEPDYCYSVDLHWLHRRVITSHASDISPILSLDVSTSNLATRNMFLNRNAADQLTLQLVLPVSL